jgi:hypothetical protein
MNDHAHHDHAHTHQDVADPPDYEGWIQAQRQSKDDYFKGAERSPIPPSERSSFAGLDYYPVTPALRFEFLRLGPLPDDLEVETHVQTSDGAVRHGERVGILSFTVDGIELRLVALKLVGSQDDSLFVPFRDATNADDTYEAGRYLDLAPQDDGSYDLDFNLAYAPFCAYSPSYSCPLAAPTNNPTTRA